MATQKQQQMTIDEATALIPAGQMTRMQDEARSIYGNAQETVESARVMGFSLSPIQQASYDEILAHLVYCAALGIIHHANVDARRYFGQSREAIAEQVAASAAARRRGRGARAVKNKYGAEAARRITGHDIR